MTALPTVLHVVCPLCDAEPEHPCVRQPSGVALKTPHRARYKQHRSVLRSTKPFVVKVVETHQQAGITAGEQYIATTSQMAPTGQVTLIRRIPHGSQLYRSVSSHQARFIRWA